MNEIIYDCVIEGKYKLELEKLIGTRISNILFFNSKFIDGEWSPDFDIQSCFSNSLTRLVFWHYPKSQYCLFDFEIECPPETIYSKIQLIQIKRFEEVWFTKGLELLHDGVKIQNTFSMQIGAPIIKKIEIYGVRAEGVREETSLDDKPVPYKVHIDSMILFYLEDGNLFVVRGSALGAGSHLLLISKSEAKEYIEERIHGAINEWGDKMFVLTHSVSS